MSRKLALLAGAALIGLGAAGYLLVMGALGGAARPLLALIPAVVAALGVWLVIGAVPRVVKAAPWRRRGGMLDLASIFLTFGAIGPLVLLIAFPSTPGPVTGLIYVAVSGAIAVSWSLSFELRRWWAVLLAVVITVVVPPWVFRGLDGLGVSSLLGDLPERSRVLALVFEVVGSLIVGYVLMARSVQLVERRAARQRAELDAAAEIHRRLAPVLDFDACGASVYGRSVPSRVMGGDLIDALRRPEGFDLVLADVAGHGVRAGVVMALVKGVIRSALREHASLDRAVSTANQALCEMLEPGVFVTAAFVRCQADKTTCLIAGHPPVLHVTDAAGDEDGLRIEHSGLPLGVVPAESYRSIPVAWQPGDTLVLYSDGLMEAMEPDGSPVGIAGLERRVRALRGETPRSIAESLLAGIESGPAPGAEPDDRTVLVIASRARAKSSTAVA